MASTAAVACACACLVLACGLRGDDTDDPVDPVDYSEVSFKEETFNTPSLDEVATGLSKGLKNYFRNVEVSVVNCPDLTKPPFNLTAPGISGRAKIVEIGGPAHLIPVVQRDKVYDLAQLFKFLGRNSGFIFGAAAGPWWLIGQNCEEIVNLSVQNGIVNQGSHVLWLDPNAAPGDSIYRMKKLSSSETRTALFGNYLLSDGRPGKVIKVVVTGRYADESFPSAMRRALNSHFEGLVMGIGGTFVMRAGRATMRVMPDFSHTPLYTAMEMEQWMHTFEMSAPIVYVGTFLTGASESEPGSPEFVGWSAHGDGGHFVHDTSPDAVRYEGYFVTANAMLRVDPPNASFDLEPGSYTSLVLGGTINGPPLKPRKKKKPRTTTTTTEAPPPTEPTEHLTINFRTPLSTTKAPPVSTTEAPTVSSTAAPAVTTTEITTVSTTEVPPTDTTQAPPKHTTQAPPTDTTQAPPTDTTQVPVVDDASLNDAKKNYANIVSKLNELPEKYKWIFTSTTRQHIGTNPELTEASPRDKASERINIQTKGSTEARSHNVEPEKTESQTDGTTTAATTERAPLSAAPTQAPQLRAHDPDVGGAKPVVHEHTHLNRNKWIKSYSSSRFNRNFNTYQWPGYATTTRPGPAMNGGAAYRPLANPSNQGRAGGYRGGDQGDVRGQAYGGNTYSSGHRGTYGDGHSNINRGANGATYGGGRGGAYDGNHGDGVPYQDTYGNPYSGSRGSAYSGTKGSAYSGTQGSANSGTHNDGVGDVRMFDIDDLPWPPQWPPPKEYMELETEPPSTGTQFVDFKTISTKKKWISPPGNLTEVLKKNLVDYFTDVRVRKTLCPDLTQPPFYLATPGLAGNVGLLDLGGYSYLMPHVQRDRNYDLAALARHLDRNNALIAGAGAGPWWLVGRNSEAIINVVMRNGTAFPNSRLVWMVGDKCRVDRPPPGDVNTAIFGNYFISDGAPGEVISITVKGRKTPQNFVNAISLSLIKAFGFRAIGMGGVFTMRTGNVTVHVMPDFSDKSLESDDDIRKWVQYFEIPAPVTFFGTLITQSMSIELQPQHFHGWSEAGLGGGHYVEDTTPDDVTYEGYFVPATHVIRIDQPYTDIPYYLD